LNNKNSKKLQYDTRKTKLKIESINYDDLNSTWRFLNDHFGALTNTTPCKESGHLIATTVNNTY